MRQFRQKLFKLFVLTSSLKFKSTEKEFVRYLCSGSSGKSFSKLFFNNMKTDVTFIQVHRKRVCPLFVFMLETFQRRKTKQKACSSSQSERKLWRKQAFYCYCEQHEKTLFLFLFRAIKMKNKKHGKMKFFVIKLSV